MKKILTIPDLHGKDTWKNVFDTSYDHIIFLGDFVDDYNKTDSEIIDNLFRIIEIKKKYPDKIILLWGNHEPQYLFGPNYYECSGFRLSAFPVLHQLLNLNKTLFQYAFQIDKHIWTHAGIHMGWWKHYFKGIDNGLIADQLNEAFTSKQYNTYNNKIETLFNCGFDRGGINKIGGPLWVDKKNMWELKALPGYHQIVGHSKVDDIITRKSRDDGSITFCDCLDKIEKFHVFEI